MINYSQGTEERQMIVAGAVLMSSFSGVTGIIKTITLVVPASATYDIRLTNLLTRFNFRDNVAKTASIFYPYLWTDTDRVDTLAYKYYDNESYHWILMYSNGSTDLYYDFPLNSKTYNDYLIAKYKEQVFANVNTLLLTDFTNFLLMDGSYLNLVESATNFDPITWNMLPYTQQLITIYQYLNSTVHSYQFYFEDKPSVVYNCDIDLYNYYTGTGPNSYITEQTIAASLGVSLPNAVASIVSLFAHENIMNEAKREVSVIDNDYANAIVSELKINLGAINSQKKIIGDI